MKKSNQRNITEEDIVQINGDSTPKNSRSGGPELDIYADDEEKLNEYYVKLSGKFRIAKFLSFAVLIIFVLCMLTAFSDDITTEKFRYLVKDMNIDIPTTSSEFGNISYTEDPEAVFAIFKNDLVSVGRHSVEIIDMAGNIVLDSDVSYVKPRISVGEKYFLVYDLSGYEFAVYNSFSVLFTETLDYPISHAYMCDDGRILIITKNEEYRCVALMYNKDYELAYTWQTNDKYVFDGVLHEDGSFTLLCSSVSNGMFDCVTVSGNMNSEDVTVSAEKNDTMGLQLNEFENGSRVIFCSGGLIFEDADGESVARVDYNSDACILTAASDSYALNIIDSASLSVGNMLNVYSSNGESVLSVSVPEHPVSAYIYGEYAYIMYTDGIIKIDISNGELKRYTSDKVINSLLQTENGILLAVGKSRAYPIDDYDFK